MHDELKEILGVELPDSRLEEDLAAYRAILVEIRKLRELDLTDVHPAVMYDPLMPYRAERAPAP